MQIAIISDTHLPRGTRRLPERCVSLLRESDLLVHAGDFVRFSVLEELRALGDVVGVAGNVDDAELHTQLPMSAVVPIGSVTLGIVHDAGLARGRLERMRRRFPQANAVVFGHSHIPLHERAPDGFQIFNPGSATDRRRAPRHTMGIARLDGRRIGFETIELD
ncbi:MAG: metallophosphatase family protein [Actinomycetota bacterium]|nr:metallophosphatase family protein [Actinomycetota bacterium]